MEELEEILLPAGVETPEISQKKEEIPVMGICIHKKDTMRVKEEISLASNKPNIHELLWDTVEIRGVDIRAKSDRIAVKGELFLFVLYRGEDDNYSLQWLEHSIPFSEEIECAGCAESMVPDVDVLLAHSELKIRTDSDGEERVLAVEAMLELEIRFMRKKRFLFYWMCILRQRNFGWSVSRQN